MRILRNYILKEFVGPLVLGMVVLNLVFTLGYLVQIANLVVNKGVDIGMVTTLFLLRIPTLLIYTLPIAALIAILLSMGRLSSDNELTTIKASGINLMRLIAPLLTLGVILSLTMVIVNDRVIPWAHFATRKMLLQVGVKNPAAALEPGVFITSFDKYILFIYAIDENKLTNIRIYEPQGDDKPARVIIAKKGEFLPIPEQNLVKLKLMDGTADEPDPENPRNFYKLNFKTYFMNLNLAGTSGRKELEKKPKDMTIRELKNEINKYHREGVETVPLLTEINEKLSLAFAPLVFILFGLPLAAITRRREKSINFGLAFLVVGIYYLMLLGTEALALQGYLDPVAAMWIPNILFACAGFYMTYKLCAS
ncbi:MAG: LptF/LptG family permease [Deltaproteobacteria bacterium]